MIFRIIAAPLVLLALFASALIHGEELRFLKTDMQQAKHAILTDGKPLVLYVAHSTCPYCKLLERDVMPALVNTEHYQQAITLQRLQWDSGIAVRWINDEPVLPDQLISRYRIFATPTLLFLNSQGEEIADRLEGYRDGDFYWVYLDKRIEQARLELKKKE